MGTDISCVPSYASIRRSCFIRIFVSTTTIIFWELFSLSSHKIFFAHVTARWRNMDNLRSFLRTFGNFFFWGIGNFSIYAFLRGTENQELLHRTFVGIHSFLFYWLLSFTMEANQLSLSVSSPGSWEGFLYFGWCNFWAEYGTVFLCCLWIFELVLGWLLIFT